MRERRRISYVAFRAGAGASQLRVVLFADTALRKENTTLV